MTKKVELKLEQNEIFIESMKPLDFKNHWGLEITYTNGKTQMLTSKDNAENHFGTHEFETNEELLEFYKKYSK